MRILKSTIQISMLFFLSSSFAQQMNRDSTSIVPNGTMSAPLNNNNAYSAVTQTIPLSARPLYQCPYLGPGSLGGGQWGYYGCRGQVSYEASCFTIEYPRRYNASCTQIN